MFPFGKHFKSPCSVEDKAPVAEEVDVDATIDTILDIFEKTIEDDEVLSKAFTPLNDMHRKVFERGIRCGLNVCLNTGIDEVLRDDADGAKAMLVECLLSDILFHEEMKRFVAEEIAKRGDE